MADYFVSFRRCRNTPATARNTEDQSLNPPNSSATPVPSRTNQEEAPIASNPPPVVSATNRAPVGPSRNQAPVGSGRNQAPVGPRRNQAPVGSGRNQAPVGSGRNQAPVNEAAVENQAPVKEAVVFTILQLAMATANFTDVIEEGSSGVMYRGTLIATGQEVAVKELDFWGLEDEEEFTAEVRLLCSLNHPNVVNTIGYCLHQGRRLVVYEYLPMRYSLNKYLRERGRRALDLPTLDWNTRMLIATGIARGLNFLHTENVPPIAYRDVRSSNIFLGQGFVAKLSDFGLARVGRRGLPTNGAQHNRGYTAPEYNANGMLTLETDIYSFGVLLMELITGSRPSKMTPGERPVIRIGDWVRSLTKNPRMLARAVDSRLGGQYPIDALDGAVRLASYCTNDVVRGPRPKSTFVMEAMKFFSSARWIPEEDEGMPALEEVVEEHAEDGGL